MNAGLSLLNENIISRLERNNETFKFVSLRIIGKADVPATRRKRNDTIV